MTELSDSLNSEVISFGGFSYSVPMSTFKASISGAARTINHWGRWSWMSGFVRNIQIRACRQHHRVWFHVHTDICLVVRFDLQSRKECWISSSHLWTRNLAMNYDPFPFLNSISSWKGGPRFPCSLANRRVAVLLPINRGPRHLPQRLTIANLLPCGRPRSR